MSALKHVGAPGEMLETVVQEKVVPGGTPVPAKKSRLSTKMAAIVAGAGVAAKENGKIVKSEGPERGRDVEEKLEEGEEVEPRKFVNGNVERSSSPPPLPEKGFRMDEPGEDDSKGEVEEGVADDGTKITPEE